MPQITVKQLPAENEITKQKLDEMLQKGLEQAKEGKGYSVEEVFQKFLQQGE